MRFIRPTMVVAFVGALVAAATMASAAPASRTAPASGAAPGSNTAAASNATAGWAPAGSAAIHPGIMTYTSGSQCTANFVFTGTGGTYLGQAAHCAGTGAQTDTDGCTAPTLGLGTEVQDVNGNAIGTIAYSSWVTMQADNESDPSTCAYNDLALIKLYPGWVGQTNPTVPIYGGPIGLRTVGLQTLDEIFALGNSSLRLGVAELSTHHGYAVQELGGGWSHQVYTVGPGIPGDSGGPLMDANGSATGVLSTVGLYPLALSNNFADLSKTLAYARAHGTSVTLVKGELPFTPVIP